MLSSDLRWSAPPSSTSLIFLFFIVPPKKRDGSIEVSRYEFLEDGFEFGSVVGSTSSTTRFIKVCHLRLSVGSMTLCEFLRASPLGPLRFGFVSFLPLFVLSFQALLKEASSSSRISRFVLPCRVSLVVETCSRGFVMGEGLVVARFVLRLVPGVL
ncbi:unnamed protein product [Cochlearia groenlandica]